MICAESPRSRAAWPRRSARLTCTPRAARTSSTPRPSSPSLPSAHSRPTWPPSSARLWPSWRRRTQRASPTAWARRTTASCPRTAAACGRQREGAHPAPSRGGRRGQAAPGALCQIGQRQRRCGRRRGTSTSASSSTGGSRARCAEIAALIREMDAVTPEDSASRREHDAATARLALGSPSLDGRVLAEPAVESSEPWASGTVSALLDGGYALVALDAAGKRKRAV